MESQILKNSLNKINWLKIAFQQPSDESIEEFYYDKSCKEFFSIIFLDLILFDKKYKSLKNIPHLFNYYELKTLNKRINKIKKKSNSIIKLPQLGYLEDTILLQKISLFLNENKIQLDKVTIFEILQINTKIPEKSKYNESKSNILIRNILKLFKK
jgi:hypothetical protein